MRRRPAPLSGFCAQYVLARGSRIEPGALGDGSIAAEPLVQESAVAGEEPVGAEVAFAHARHEALLGIQAAGGLRIRLVRAREEHAPHGLLELAHVTRPGIPARHVPR